MNLVSNKLETLYSSAQRLNILEPGGTERELKQVFVANVVRVVFEDAAGRTNMSTNIINQIFRYKIIVIRPALGQRLVFAGKTVMMFFK